MVKTIIQNKRLYLLWIILVLLITACIATSTLLSLAAFVVLVGAALLLPSNEAIVLLMSLLPFANIFKLSPNSTSLFTITELALVVVLIFKIKKIRTSFLLALMALAVYVIALSFENFNALLVIKFLFGFLLIYFAMQVLGRDDVKNIAYLLAMGSIIMMVFTLNKPYLEFVLPYYEDINTLLVGGNGELTLRASGFFGDPNYCSLFLMLTLAMLCTLYYHKQVKAEFWLLFVPISVLGFFTYSKSYFLCLAALILFLIVFVLFPKHKGWAIFAIIALGAFLALIFYGKIEAINIIVERFKEKDLTTGRSELNRIYLDYIWENPVTMFFGEGFGADVIEGAKNNVHNIYIESLLKLGMVGCIAYLLSLKLALGNIKLRGKKVADFLPLIFMLVVYVFLAGITAYDMPFYVALSFLALKSDALTTKNQELNNMQLK